MSENVNHGKLSHLCPYCIPEESLKNTPCTKAWSNADESSTSRKHGGSCSLQAGEDCVRWYH